MWHQGWIFGSALGIPQDLSWEWANYLLLLRNTHTRLSARADSLIWVHHTSGKYTPKHGYIRLNVVVQNRPVIWWWKKLWKL